MNSADVADYLERLRAASTSVNPPGWEVDWNAAPWTTTVLHGGTRIPLKSLMGTPARPLAETLYAAVCIHRVRVGRLENEARAHAKTSSVASPPFTLRRPVASGGARYPVDVYVVELSTGTAWLVDPYRHELVCATADSRGGSAPSGNSPVTLMLVVSFWRSACKYGEFSYRLTAVDAGLMMGRLRRLVAGAQGDAHVLMNIEEDEWAARLGLTQDEDIYAKVDGLVCPALEDPFGGPPQPAVGRRERDGVRPVELPFLASARKAAAESRLPPPLHEGVGPAAAEVTPEVIPVHAPARRSAITDMLPHPVQKNTAIRILAAMSTEAEAVRRSTDSRLPEVELHCCVVRVHGVPAGWYRFDAQRSLLVPAGDPGDGYVSAQLQRAQFSTTVNAELAALTIHPVSDVAPWESPGGVRLYRAQQLLIGAVVDACTVVAVNEGLGSHIFLGVDATALDHHYGVSTSGRGVQAQVCIGPVRSCPDPEITVR
ncbi:hypothetical protein MHK71_01645 [Kocuria indica]|uniref:hypothetical protein n=1 Tax=Kocuria marina TaxID=223184 RepID=UPI001EF6D2D0|nr:hypothetical protein [Kocuria indica]MCG7431227.1 hypothetical protein [Kocuria indica]